MSVPYAFISILKGLGNPNIEEFQRMSSKEAVSHLMAGGNMKGKYLGACLDSCRDACINAVFWPVNVRGLMGIIEKWRHENDDNPQLYHRHSMGDLYKRFELPHINHDKCPRNKDIHHSTFRDSGGRLRCKHRSVKTAKPSFIVDSRGSFDELSQMLTRDVYEVEPEDPTYEDDDGKINRPEDEWTNYINKIDLWNSEESTAEIVDVCYALMDDRGIVLPFENVLERMNLAERYRVFYCGNDPTGECKIGKNNHVHHVCFGHQEFNDQTVFPFDGWDLAFYLQKWKEQVKSGEPPWFAKKPERWNITNRSKFTFLSSED